MSTPHYGPGIEITGRITPEYAADPDARSGRARGQAATRVRRPSRRPACPPWTQRQSELDAGTLPDFLAETRAIREGDWTCAPIPADIVDRRVEITGPVDRKMVINALNSGANVFMADFEDANTPKWDNNLQGHLNLRDAIRRRIDYTSPEGKAYRLNAQTAVLFVRPRGWHLPEKHVLIDGQPISGGIFDFALYVVPQRQGAPRPRQRTRISTCPSSRAISRRGSGTTSSSWRRTSSACRAARFAPTVLIETLLAAFEMDEILYELREHSAGLNCGRWDYIFSCIKKLRNNHRFLPRRPRARHDDDALHEELCAVAGQDLPPPQHPRDGRDGGADPGQERRSRECRGLRQGESRQGARGDAGPRRHLGRAPGSRAGRERGVRPADAGAESDRDQEGRGREGDGGRPPQVRARVPDHGEGAAPQHQRRDPVRRRLARRAGSGADLQPDGGCGDRRDLALAGLAVDPLAERRERRSGSGSARRKAGSTTAARSRRKWWRR